jgi:DNA helicase II / ATP-dependent DNA helicase PcrA
MKELDANQRKAVESNATRILVSSVPGSGKTFTIVCRFAHMIDVFKHDSHNMVLLTFTRYAANEMKGRIGPVKSRGAFIGTFHSFALHLIEMYGTTRQWEPEWITILDEEEAQLEQDSALRDMGIINTMGKWSADLKRYDWEKFVESKLTGSDEYLHRINPVHLERYENAWKAFYDRLRSENCLTYGTMILEAMALIQDPATGDLLRKRYQHFLVDEAQDSDANQWNLVELFKPQTLFVVGDGDQCQPAGTLVRLSSGGDCPIEHIKAGDSVNSYERHSKVIMKTATVNAVAMRYYSGNLYSVTAGGKTTECTASHKWLIKWLTAEQRTSSIWCTYIMRKGDYFRVGKTMFFRSCGHPSKANFAIGLPLRMRQEHADAGWVLKLHETEAEATAYEQIVAATYGLPEACFTASNNCRHFTQDVIDSIFVNIPDQMQKAVRCLNAHGRDLLYPLFHIGQVRSRRTVQEIQACNMLNDVMHVPIAPDILTHQNRGGRWELVKVSYRPFNGPVYSLDIHKYHKYIANGLVTCNSIYSWRGGRPDLFLKYAEGSTQYQLPRSYRFGFNLAAPANELIKRNQDRIDIAIEAISDNAGMVQTVKDAQFTDIADILKEELKTHKPTDIAVLSRRHVTLDALANTLEAERLPFVQCGGQNDITKRPEFRIVRGLLRLAVNPLDRRAFMAVVPALGYDTEKIWEIRSIAVADSISLLKAAGFKNPPDHLSAQTWLRENDKLHDYEMIFSYLNDIVYREAIAETAELVKYLALADIQDQMATVNDSVTLSTIHGAKGLEWPVVLIAGMNADNFPSKRSIKEGRAEEERRLFYVAITRAEQKLYIIQNTPQHTKDGPSMFLSEIGLLPEYKPQSKQDDDNLVM